MHSALCNVHCALCVVQSALQCASQRAVEDTVSSSSEFLESLSNEQHVLGCSADVQIPAQVLARSHCSTRGWLRRQRAGRHQRGGTGSPAAPAPWHQHQQPAPTLPYRARLSFSSTYYLVASPRTVCTALHLPRGGAATSTQLNRVVDPGVHLGWHGSVHGGVHITVQCSVYD